MSSVFIGDESSTIKAKRRRGGVRNSRDAWVQAAWEEERWRAFRESASGEELVRLREQVGALAARSTDEAHHFIQTTADALYFDELQKSRGWLEDLGSWVEGDEHDTHALQRL